MWVRGPRSVGGGGVESGWTRGGLAGEEVVTEVVRGPSRLGVVSDRLIFHILGLLYGKHTTEQLYLKSGISRRKLESLYPVVI